MNVARFRIGHSRQELNLSNVEKKGGRVEASTGSNREKVRVFDAKGRETLRLEFLEGKCVRRETMQYEKDGSVVISSQEDIDGDGSVDSRSRIVKKEGRAISIKSEVRVRGSDHFEPLNITYQ